MSSVIGLDLGSAAIKVARVRRTWGGVRITHCTTVQTADREDLAPALQQVLGEGGNGQVVAGVALSSASVRFLSLPFGQVRQVRQVIAYEMEGLIPFPVEEMVVASQILDGETSASGGQSSRVMAVAVHKTLVRQHLETLARAHVNPQVLTLDGSSLHTFARFYFGELEAPLALIEIGSRKTTVCVVERGALRLLRAFPIGGHALTVAIQDTLGRSFEEAEHWKRTASVHDETVRRALEPFMTELRRTLHLFEAESQASLSAIFPCGGGSLLQGLQDYLAQTFQVELVKPPALGEGADWALYPTAIGLALQGALRQEHEGINLRTGEFVSGEAVVARRQRWWIGAGLTALALLGTADLGLYYGLKEARYRELKLEVRQTFRETFPQVLNVVDEVQQARAIVQGLAGEATFLGGMGLTPLQVLESLTNRLPPDLSLELQNFVVDAGTIRFEAVAESFQAVDRVKMVIQGAPWVETATVSNAKLTVDRAGVRFRVTIVMKERA